MDQETFTEDLLRTWEMDRCRPVATPGEPKTGVELPSDYEVFPEPNRAASTEARRVADLVEHKNTTRHRRCAVENIILVHQVAITSIGRRLEGVEVPEGNGGHSPLVQAM